MVWGDKGGVVLEARISQIYTAAAEATWRRRSEVGQNRSRFRAMFLSRFVYTDRISELLLSFFSSFLSSSTDRIAGREYEEMERRALSAPSPKTLAGPRIWSGRRLSLFLSVPHQARPVPSEACFLV